MLAHHHAELDAAAVPPHSSSVESCAETRAPQEIQTGLPAIADRRCVPADFGEFRNVHRGMVEFFCDFAGWNSGNKEQVRKKTACGRLVDEDRHFCLCYHMANKLATPWTAAVITGMYHHSKRHA